MTTSVVIADDDDDVRLLLRVVLGHESDFSIVGEAATPEEAVELAASLQPDVIVIDHEFRGYRTGAETAPVLRERCPEAIIVMFSAYDAVRDQIQEDAEIDAFVLKTDVTALAALIRSTLQERDHR